MGRDAHLLRHVLIGLLVGVRGAHAHILRSLCLQQNLQPGTLNVPEPVAEQPESCSRAPAWTAPAQTVKIQGAATALGQLAGPSQTCATAGPTWGATSGSECCKLDAWEPLHGTWLASNLCHEVVKSGVITPSGSGIPKLGQAQAVVYTAWAVQKALLILPRASCPSGPGTNP